MDGNASRNCCTIHMLVGCFVTLKYRMRRRSWAMIKKTVKQSIAAMASGWLRRKVSQRLAGSGSLGARSYPARNCSFGDIKTEHEKFSMDARRSPCGVLGHHLWEIRCRTSFDVCLVPMGFLA
jgi:hypothetical protein